MGAWGLRRQSQTATSRCVALQQAPAQPCPALMHTASTLPAGPSVGTCSNSARQAWASSSAGGTPTRQDDGGHVVRAQRHGAQRGHRVGRVLVLVSVPRRADVMLRAGQRRRGGQVGWLGRWGGDLRASIDRTAAEGCRLQGRGTPGTGWAGLAVGQPAGHAKHRIGRLGAWAAPTCHSMPPSESYADSSPRLLRKTARPAAAVTAAGGRCTRMWRVGLAVTSATSGQKARPRDRKEPWEVAAQRMLHVSATLVPLGHGRRHADPGRTLLAHARTEVTVLAGLRQEDGRCYLRGRGPACRGQGCH